MSPSLREENRALTAQVGSQRLRLNDGQRRGLAVLEQLLGHLTVVASLYRWKGQTLDLYAPFHKFGVQLRPSLVAPVIVVGAAMAAELWETGLDRLDNFLFTRYRENWGPALLAAPLFTLGLGFLMAVFSYASIFLAYVATSFLRSLFGFIGAIVLVVALDRAIPYLRAGWVWLNS